MYNKKGFWYDLYKNIGQSIDWLYAKNISAKKRPWYRKLLRYLWISYTLIYVVSILIYGVFLENHEILKFFSSFCGLSENFLDNLRSFLGYYLCSIFPVFFMLITASLLLFKGKRLRFNLLKELMDAWNFFMLSLSTFFIGLSSVLLFDFTALGSMWILNIKFYGNNDIVIFVGMLLIFLFLMPIMSGVCIYNIHGYLAYNSAYWKKYIIKREYYNTLGIWMFGPLALLEFLLIDEQNNIMLFAKKAIGMILFYHIFLFFWFVPAHYDAINEYRKRIIKM